MFPAYAIGWGFWFNAGFGAAPILAEDRARSGQDDDPPASELESAAFEAVEAPMAEPPASQVVVLLIEDNEADVFITNQVLKTCGFPFRLEVISDGEAGVEFMKSIESDPQAACPGIILLDLNLPRVSGIEVFRELRKGKRCRHIPVIVVTSSDSPQDVAAVRDLNAAAYFRKPTSLLGYMRLAEVIRQVLGNPGTSD